MSNYLKALEALPLSYSLLQYAERPDGAVAENRVDLMKSAAEAVYIFAPHAFKSDILLYSVLEKARSFGVLPVEDLLKLQELSDDYSVLHMDEADFQENFLRLEMLVIDMRAVIDNHQVGNALSGEGALLLSTLLCEALACWGICRSFEGGDISMVQESLVNIFLAMWQKEDDWLEQTAQVLQQVEDQVIGYKANMGLSHEITREDFDNYRAMSQ